MILPCKAIVGGPHLSAIRSVVSTFRYSLRLKNYFSLATLIIDSRKTVLKAGLRGHNLRSTVKRQSPNTVDIVALSHNLSNLDRNQRRSVTNFDRLKEVSKQLVLKRYLQCKVVRC